MKPCNVVYRDVGDVLQRILLNPALRQPGAITYHTQFPENGFGRRVYSDNMDGDWAIREEAELPWGACLLSLILYTDATQVGLFSGTKAYPGYLSIGNINKHVRKGDWPK